MIVQKSKIFHSIIENGWHGAGYICTFIVTNILFVISIENTNFHDVKKVVQKTNEMMEEWESRVEKLLQQ